MARGHVCCVRAFNMCVCCMCSVLKSVVQFLWALTISMQIKYAYSYNSASVASSTNKID